MSEILGLGKLSRERLAAVLRQAKGSPISPIQTAGILGVTRTEAAKMLAYWAHQGWLSRIRRGLYLQVPLQAMSSDLPIDSPWIIATELYAPCYMGGWTASEYWGLTEQSFRTVVVMTNKRPRDRNPTIKNITFQLQTISNEKMFGLKPVWQDQVKVQFSDPTRTVIDLLSDPALGGGIRSVIDMLQNYWKSGYNAPDLLIDYADKFNNGAVFKRLGYLVEKYFPKQEKILTICREKLTKGNARLDPALPSEFLITRWNLWVSKNYR